VACLADSRGGVHVTHQVEKAAKQARREARKQQAEVAAAKARVDAERRARRYPRNNGRLRLHGGETPLPVTPRRAAPHGQGLNYRPEVNWKDAANKLQAFNAVALSAPASKTQPLIAAATIDLIDEGPSDALTASPTQTTRQELEQMLSLARVHSWDAG
jgi:hypothetical protein